MVYCMGNLIVSITSIAPIGQKKAIGPIIGLFLIALGTGGIKPCVSAFGGDQFTADQSHLLQSFFSVFYFAINAGSLLSMLITPALRGKITEMPNRRILHSLLPIHFIPVFPFWQKYVNTINLFGWISQLVEHYTGIEEVRDQVLFMCFSCYYLISQHYCKDHLHRKLKSCLSTLMQPIFLASNLV